MRETIQKRLTTIEDMLGTKQRTPCVFVAPSTTLQDARRQLEQQLGHPVTDEQFPREMKRAFLVYWEVVTRTGVERNSWIGTYRNDTPAPV